MTEPNNEVGKYAAKLSQVTSMAVQACIIEYNKETGSRNRVDDVYLAACGVIGALHILASMLGHHGDKNRESVERSDITKLVNPISTLAAALLAQSMSPEAGNETQDTKDGLGVNTPVEFGPHMVLGAIQQVERMIGRPVDGYLHPPMLQNLRKVAEDADEPMNRFLAQRRPTPGNLH